MKPAERHVRPETKPPCLEIMILWGSSVLHVEHRSPPRSISVGSAASGAEGHLAVPVPSLGERVPLVDAGEGGAVTLVVPEGAGGWVEIAGEARRDAGQIDERRLPFPAGSKARLELEHLVFSVSLTAATPAPARLRRLDRRYLPYLLGSGVLQLGALWALSLFRGPALDPGEVSQEQIYTLQAALAEIDEKAAERSAAEQAAGASAAWSV